MRTIETILKENIVFKNVVPSVSDVSLGLKRLIWQILDKGKKLQIMAS